MAVVVVLAATLVAPPAGGSTDRAAASTSDAGRFTDYAGAATDRPAASTAMDETSTLAVDGAALYLRLRGDDAAAPILVWLHGGPGAPERPLFRHFDAALEHRFVVAYAPRAAQRSEWEFATTEAVRRDDTDVRAELAALGPPPYATAMQVLALERIAERYGAVYRQAPSRTWVLLSGLVRGLITPWELPRFFRANDASLAAMQPELLDLDLRRSLPAVAVPVVFFLGRYDRHADAQIAAAYLDGLAAPAKRIVWFERSAHNPPFEEPERFVAAVVDELGAFAPSAVAAPP